MENWALRTGHTLAHTREGRRLTVLVVPDRLPIAVLAATGFIVSRGGSRAAEQDPLEWFARLLEMEPGTNVRLTHRGKILRGALDPRPLTSEVWVQTAGKRRNGGGETFRKVLPEDSLRVALADARAPALRVSEQPIRVKGDPAFLSACMPGIDPQAWRSTTRDEVVLVGRKAWMEEAAWMEVRIQSQDGTLAHLIRPRDLVSTGTGYRCRMVAAAPEMSVEPASSVPRLVIFDGARAWLHGGHLWRDSSRLVVLNRREPGAEDAAASLAGEMLHRSAQGPSSPVGDPPALCQSLDMLYP